MNIQDALFEVRKQNENMRQQIEDAQFNQPVEEIYKRPRSSIGKSDFEKDISKYYTEAYLLEQLNTAVTDGAELRARLTFYKTSREEQFRFVAANLKALCGRVLEQPE